MKKVIIGGGEPWPKKRNPEFDRIYKKGADGELGPAAQTRFKSALEDIENLKL